MPPQAQGPGAIPRVLFAQISGLTAAGHQVSVVTVAGPDPAEWSAVEQLQETGLEVQAVRRVEPSGWARWKRRWRFASAWLSGRYPWRTVWFWEPGLQQRLDRLLSERAFDLVIVEDNAMGIYKYKTTRPVIFTEHEVRRPRAINWRGLIKTPGLQRLLSEIDWHRWPRYQRNVWRCFKLIQVFTPYDAAGINKIAPELAGRVRVNPFSIDLPAQADPVLEETGTLLFTGNFTHPPNVDAALWLANEIMPLLRQGWPGVRLTLAGSYPPEQVRSLECEDIIVTGYVEQMEPLVERASVIVAPLRIGGGQRMKVLEGMAMGKAVVTTPRGAEGLLVAAEEPPLLIATTGEEFARVTVELLQDRSARLALGQQARAFVVEYFSPAAYARRLEIIYGDLLQLETAG
jgi:glycosyltransferase involved in cell wall biosynthesis